MRRGGRGAEPLRRAALGNSLRGDRPGLSSCSRGSRAPWVAEENEPPRSPRFHPIQPRVSLRNLGILWVVAGFVSLFLAYAREPRNTPLLVVGMLLVAIGAAMIRRSIRGRS